MATTTNPLVQLSINAAVIQLQGLVSKITNSIKDLSVVKTDDSAALQEEYTTLQTSIREVIADSNTSDPDKLLSDVKDYQKDTHDLDAKRDTIMGTYSGNVGFLTAVGREFLYYSTMVIYIIGPLFGFIIMSNAFFDESIPLKLFYGFWGALWYPLSLLYSLFNPPVWRSLLFPLIRDDEPFMFLEVWKYHVTVDIDETAKGQLMMRIVSGGILALFGYCFFFNGN
jgi:hypothetical protein